MNRLVFLLLITCVGGIAQAQNSNFNVQFVSETKPYSGKQYGDIWSEDDIACLGIFSGYDSFSSPYGVGIYSITNPASPNLLSVYTYGPNSTQNQFEQGAVRNKIGFFASWSSGGLHIVSLTNPSAPVLLSRIKVASTATNVVADGFDRVHTMFLERDFLYEASHVAGSHGTNVKVFNIKNPHMPVYLQDIKTTNTSRVHQMSVAQKGTNTILYTSGWGDSGATLGQTDIWDVTHVGRAPARWLGRIFSGPRSHSSWPTPDGDSLIVCREITGGEVTIYDITDPTSPKVQSVISPFTMGLGGSEMPHNPVVAGNLLFLSWYRHGIQIFNIEDRAKPIRVGSYDTFLTSSFTTWEGNWGIDPSQGLDKLLLSDMQRGLIILDASGVLTGTNNYAPFLIKSPSSQLGNQGSSVTFTSVFTGSSLNYRWQLNGSDIPGATASSYTIPNAQPSHSGSYTVRAFNSNGSVLSEAANLSLILSNSPPQITAQPQSVSVYPEQSVTLSIAVLGGTPLSYYWRLNDIDIPNATNSSYTIPSVRYNDTGDYTVIVVNNYGSALSSAARVSLIDSPYISGVMANPGLRSAMISWTTTLPTDSKVDFGPLEQGSITGTSVRDSVLSTNHAVLLTGLEPNTIYNFQAISKASGTNYLSAVYQFTTAGGPIIVDNAHSEATFSGDWTPASATVGFYGTNYSFANVVSGSPTHSATFRPKILFAGKYDIDVSYTTGGNRATNAPYSISYADGNTTVHINQRSSIGQWNPLGKDLSFLAGTNGYVRLGNNASASVVIADAVRFSYSTNQPGPAEGSFPAWWREFYFDGPVIPLDDHDGDGFTTGDEYILGTSPVSSNHGLIVRVFRSGNTANVLFHPMHAGRTYKLQQRASLPGASWQAVDLEAATANSDGDGVFTLSLNGALQNFYRISVELSAETSAAPASQRSSRPSVRRMFVGAFAEPGCGPTRIYAQ